LTIFLFNGTINSYEGLLSYTNIQLYKYTKHTENTYGLFTT
jgi:hypothetical protein